MKVLSCNIRYSAAPDGEDSWPHRRAVCARVIRAQDADVIGFQEMAPDQLEYLAAALPGYAAISTLDRAGEGDPNNTIFYRPDRFRVVSQGAYWLSETPHVAGSRSWASDCIRYACWVQLRDGRGWSLRVVNTHLDHVSQPARQGQARVVNEDAAAYAPDFPQILTGDMNADAANPAIGSFLAAGWEDTYRAVHGVLDPGRTYHEFQGESCADPLGKIDWIFTRGAVRARAAEVIRDRPEGRWPSDHYFVSARVEPEPSPARPDLVRT